MNFTQDIRLSYYFDTLSAMFEQDVQTKRHAPRMARWSWLRHSYSHFSEVIRKTYIRSTREGASSHAQANDNLPRETPLKKAPRKSAGPKLLLISPNDSSLGQIVRGKL